MKILMIVLAALSPALLVAQERDTAVADSTRRLRGIEVRAERVGTNLPNPLLLLTATSVTDASSIAEAPARILPDALREMPGVQVQQTNAGHGTVILRGMVGNQVLLLLDGMRLNNATVRDGPNQYLSLIDPERVERVEVVRGPGSVLFGSDAMGGVVNMVTRAVPRRPGARIALGGSSSDNGLRARLSAWQPISARLRGAAGLGADFVQDVRAGRGIGTQEGTSYRAYSGDARLEYDAGACEVISFSLQGASLENVSRYDRLVDWRAPAPGADAEFRFVPQTHLLASARYDGRGCEGGIRGRGFAVGVQSQREGRLSRGQSVDNAGTVTLEPEREYQRDDVLTVFAAAYLEPRLRPGTSLRFGADVHDDRVSSSGYTEDVISGARTPTTRPAGGDQVAAGRFPDGARALYAGAFAHGAHLLGARWRVLGGARLNAVQVRLRAGDDFGGDVDATNTALTAHAGLTLYAGRSVSLGAHIGQGFRAPNIYDFSTVTNVPGGVVLPNPVLGPERGTTYELSARLDHATGSITLVGYQTRISDAIDRIPGSYQGDTLFNGRRVFRAANLARATISGMEAGAGAVSGPWSFRVQGFLTRGTQDSPSGGREPMAKIPPVSGSFAIRRLVIQQRAGWLELSVRSAADQRRLSARDLSDTRIQPGGTPGWWTAGLRGSLTFGDATRLNYGLENLLDRGYREHGSGIDSPGRHVWVRVERQLVGR